MTSPTPLVLAPFKFGDKVEIHCPNPTPARVEACRWIVPSDVWSVPHWEVTAKATNGETIVSIASRVKKLQETKL
jgi:hypothetical protein